MMRRDRLSGRGRGSGCYIKMVAGSKNWPITVIMGKSSFRGDFRYTSLYVASLVIGKKRVWRSV